MPASIFQGPTVKILKDALQFFGGNKITYKGSVNPSVSAIAGDFGDLYVQASTSTVYVKQDSGTSTNWKPVQVDATVTLNTLYVDKSGNDSTGDGSIQKPFLTVAAAMAAVTAPTTSNRYLISLGVGTFNETTLALKPWTWIRGSGTLQGGASRITTSTNEITLDPSLATGGQRFGLQNLYLTGSTGLNFDRQAISGAGSIVAEIYNIGVNGAITFLANQSTLDFFDARNLRVFGNCTFSGGSINIYDSEIQAALTYNTSGTQDLASSVINTPVGGNISVTSTGLNTAAVNLFTSRVTGTTTVTGSGSTLNTPLSSYIPATPADWVSVPAYINTALDELADRASNAGDVTGPGSATDNTLPRFDGTTGKIIQTSGVSIDDSNLMQGVDQVQVARDAATSLELVTLQQLQAYASGVRNIIPAKAASTANLTLSGPQTVDTIALIAGDTVLVKNQTNQTENGAYVVAAGAWTRSPLADTASKLEQLLVTIGQGTQENTGWYQISDSVTIGVTNLVFEQFFGAGSYTADGLGIELTGSTFSLELDGSTLSKSASGLRVASGGITNTEISATAAIDATKIADGSVNNTEFQYLDGVTSSIQTQLNGKQATGNYITALTGDVAATGPGSVAATISANAVTNGKLAQMANNTIKGNDSGATADPQDLTGTEVTALLDTFTSTEKGLTPASGGGSVNFLRADGSWAAPAGAGNVNGPGSATDNAITRFDGTTGKLIQNSLAFIDDLGNITGTNLSGVNTGDITVTDTTTIDLTLISQNLSADLADTAVAPDTYGAADRVGTFTVDQQGRLTDAVDVVIAIPSTQITDFTEAAQDAVAAALVDTATIDFTYNDVSNNISADVKAGSITNVLVASGIDAIKIASGVVSNTEFEYLDGVTSSIQTQLDGKQATGNYITALTGDVTASGPGSVASTISANAVTNSKLAQMANNTIKGNDSGSTADPQDLTGTEVTALLDTFTAVAKGLAPASGGGTSNFLRADGTWSTPIGSGDVNGPASATDNAITRFDGTTGKLVQNSLLIAQDDGRLTLGADGSGSLDAVTLQQLQAYVQGIKTILNARVATTANITLSGPQTIDGVSVIAGQKVLVKNQTTTTENGLYDVAAGAWSRNSEANTGLELEHLLVTIAEGTQANTGWYQQADNVIIGTTPIVFVQFFGAGTYTADGQGIELTGSTFSLELDGSTLSKSASGLKVATSGITNTEVSASAAIDYSKLNLVNSIVNADVAAAAAIAYSKLALTNSIVNADVATGAAIAYSKLNLTNSIVNADIATGAAIAYSKLNLSNSIVNADIATAAAIARSKLASGNAYRIIANDATGVMSENAAITGARAVASDANGQLVASTTTATELGYVAGVTSSIQTQLDAKSQNYTVASLNTDITLVDNTLYLVDTTAARSLTLPVAATAGRRVYIKDATGNAVQFPIILTPSGGATIDTVAGAYTIDVPFSGTELISNAAGNWFII